MKTDPELIRDAYEDAVKQVFAVFVQSCASAQNPADQQQAEQRFVAGITTARTARDRALAVLP